MKQKPTYQELKQELSKIKQELEAIKLSKDITESKNIENELKLSKHKAEESEKNFRYMFNYAPDGIVITDTKAVILMANNKASELTGYSQEEMIGMDSTKFFSAKTNIQNPLQLKEVLEGKVILNERRLIRKNGSEIDVEMRTNLMQDNRFQIFFMDIVERKQMEEKMQKHTFHLSESVKELNCLYGLFKLEEKTDISIDGILEGLINIIPFSWQYPDITCAKIIFNKQEFKTVNYKDTKWIQSNDIEAHGKKVGEIIITYLEEHQ